MKRSIIALLQAGFWICYFVLVMVILAAVFGTQEDVPESKIELVFSVIFGFAMVPAAISFYAYFYFLFPKFVLQKRYARSVLYGLLIAIGAALVGYGMISNISTESCFKEEGVDTFLGVMAFMTFNTLSAGVVALIMQGCIHWRNELKQKEELSEKNHKMEMALVKSQLDPHFLFNTINNIDVLILKDAKEASNYLNRLSDIMRFMLFETKTDEIPLSKEIEYIEKYIELQKIRTANSNYINYSLHGSPEGKTIAPMVFIPFIENAFKHTTNKKLDDAINIQVFMQNGSIRLECINKIDPNRKLKQESNGLGNGLIQKRLNLLYPDSHTLDIQHENNLYSVHLIINNG
jgi:sensor histidine kinase YesM